MRLIKQHIVKFKLKAHSRIRLPNSTTRLSLLDTSWHKGAPTKFVHKYTSGYLFMTQETARAQGERPLRNLALIRSSSSYTLAATTREKINELEKAMPTCSAQHQQHTAHLAYQNTQSAKLDARYLEHYHSVVSLHTI